jgi:hypothetical protein
MEREYGIVKSWHSGTLMYCMFLLDLFCIFSLDRCTESMVKIM